MNCLCIAKEIFNIVELIIDIRSKIVIGHPDALNELLNLLNRYDEFNKQEKKLILNTIKQFLEHNISVNNSKVNLS